MVDRNIWLVRTSVLALLLLLVGTSCGAVDSGTQASRVLFVGNSLTYVGNTPAVYSALARANGHAVSSDMIARGGATLVERLNDGSVERALADGDYTVLVLQERGGDLMCSSGPDSCRDSRWAIGVFADLAREQGVKVVLMGTYQPLAPSSSRRLVQEEAVVAAETGILHVEVSETLGRLREAEPDLKWFAEDDAHPGQDLALLNALLLYRGLHGDFPPADALVVQAPIYGATSGLDGALRGAEVPPPLRETPRKIRYSANRMAAVICEV